MTLIPIYYLGILHALLFQLDKPYKNKSKNVYSFLFLHIINSFHWLNLSTSGIKYCPRLNNLKNLFLKTKCICVDYILKNNSIEFYENLRDCF